MEHAAQLIDAISALLWPLAAICIIIILLPVIPAVIVDREFTLKIGGFELSAQQATEKIRKQLTDLQNKIVALEAAGPASTRETAPFSDAPVGELKMLWVDDHPRNNAFESESFRQDGYKVNQVRTTKEALAALRAGGVDIIISDMGRVEYGRKDTEAGINLLRSMRDAADETAFAFYITRSSAGHFAGEAKDLGAIEMTDSFTSLSAALKRHFADAAQREGA